MLEDSNKQELKSETTEEKVHPEKEQNSQPKYWELKKENDNIKRKLENLEKEMELNNLVSKEYPKFDSGKVKKLIKAGFEKEEIEEMLSKTPKVINNNLDDKVLEQVEKIVKEDTIPKKEIESPKQDNDNIYSKMAKETDEWLKDYLGKKNKK